MALHGLSDNDLCHMSALVMDLQNQRLTGDEVEDQCNNIGDGDDDIFLCIKNLVEARVLSHADAYNLLKQTRDAANREMAELQVWTPLPQPELPAGMTATPSDNGFGDDITLITIAGHAPTGAHKINGGTLYFMEFDNGLFAVFDPEDKALGCMTAIGKAMQPMLAHDPSEGFVSAWAQVLMTNAAIWFTDGEDQDVDERIRMVTNGSNVWLEVTYYENEEEEMKELTGPIATI